MTEATLEAMVERVRFHAGANPNHIYKIPNNGSTCLYFHLDGKAPVCGCIMGHALQDLGFTSEDLVKHEGKDIADVIADLDIDPEGPAYYTRVSWLFEVQTHQDDQRPWQRCVEEADEAYPNV
jgi:hypothetical protein